MNERPNFSMLGKKEDAKAETKVSENLFSGMGVVAHTYNPSYPRGRNQKDCGLKPTQAKILVRPPS
jgi:hypothetical protein